MRYGVTDIEYYVVRARFVSRKDATDVAMLYVGMVRGMTDSGQPGWVSGGPTHFKTAEDARTHADAHWLVNPWDYTMVAGSVEVVRTRVATVTITEEEVLR